MDKDLKKLSDAELEIMLVVWEAGDAVGSNYILEHLEGKRSWALPTLMTVLSRLVKKGYLTCEKQGRNNTYLANIEEKTYKEKEGKSFLERMYNNSFKSFVTSLYNSKAIGDQDIKELQRIIDEAKKEE